MNLKSMSLDRLADLRDQVNSTLSAKVVDHRRSLESELSKLSRFQGRTTTKSAFGHGAARRVLAPKYRNPQNSSETWAGRGLKPRWLTAATKTGKKMDDFLISGASSLPKASGRRKTRKARK